MTLSEAYDFLNFWIGKHTGAYYTPEQLDAITDRGQMSLFSDYILRYGTSQRLRDALSPFKSSYEFTTGTTPAGLITIPTNKNMVAFLDGYVTFTDSRYAFPQNEIVFPNEDELTIKLKSQLDPVTITDPVGEWVGTNTIQLWPKVPNQGKLTFYRRPVKPNFVYSIISNRVIVYDGTTSVQLEWKEGDINAVLLKALESIGINLKDSEILGYAYEKTTGNFNNFNKT